MRLAAVDGPRGRVDTDLYELNECMEITWDPIFPLDSAAIVQGALLADLQVRHVL